MICVVVVQGVGMRRDRQIKSKRVRPNIEIPRSPLFGRYSVGSCVVEIKGRGGVLTATLQTAQNSAVARDVAVNLGVPTQGRRLLVRCCSPVIRPHCNKQYASLTACAGLADGYSAGGIQSLQSNDDSSCMR